MSSSITTFLDHGLSDGFVNSGPGLGYGPRNTGFRGKSRIESFNIYDTNYENRNLGYPSSVPYGNYLNPGFGNGPSFIPGYGQPNLIRPRPFEDVDFDYTNQYRDFQLPIVSPQTFEGTPMLPNVMTELPGRVYDGMPYGNIYPAPYGY